MHSFAYTDNTCAANTLGKRKKGGNVPERDGKQRNVGGINDFCCHDGNHIIKIKILLTFFFGDQLRLLAKKMKKNEKNEKK